MEFDHPTEFRLRQIAKMFNEAVEQFAEEYDKVEHEDSLYSQATVHSVENVFNFLSECDEYKRLFWFLDGLRAASSVMRFKNYSDFLKREIDTHP